MYLRLIAFGGDPRDEHPPGRLQVFASLRKGMQMDCHAVRRGEDQRTKCLHLFMTQLARIECHHRIGGRLVGGLNSAKNTLLQLFIEKGSSHEGDINACYVVAHLAEPKGVLSDTLEPLPKGNLRRERRHFQPHGELSECLEHNFFNGREMMKQV